MGEQPNPWNLLQLQDKVSRHRGAELRRRCGRLGGTSLFNAFAFRLYLHPASVYKLGWRRHVAIPNLSELPDAIASSRYGVTKVIYI